MFHLSLEELQNILVVCYFLFNTLNCKYKCCSKLKQVFVLNKIMALQLFLVTGIKNTIIGIISSYFSF